MEPWIVIRARLSAGDLAALGPIKQALRKADGSPRGAAAILGCSKSAIYAAISAYPQLQAALAEHGTAVERTLRHRVKRSGT